MKTIIKAVREIIHPDAIIPNHPILRIEETRNIEQAKCRFVELKGLKGQSIVFKLDDEKLGRISNYLRPQEAGINRACDAVIFTRVEKRNFIFFIELKSQNPKGAYEQLRNGELFVAYLGSILKAYKWIDINNFQKRFFIFCTNPGLKNPTGKSAKITSKTKNSKKIFIYNCNETISIDRFKLLS